MTLLVIHGDTGVVQYGIGTFGSRATAVGGTGGTECDPEVEREGSTRSPRI